MILPLPLILRSDRACRGRVSKGWIIDLGPEGGDKGGEIVAEAEHEGRSGGSFIARKPEQVAEEPRSYTGHYLKPLLRGPRVEASDAPAKKKRGSAPAREREAAE